MKTLKSIIFSIMIIALACALYSCGSVKLVKGDLEFLKGQKTFKIEYDYSGMSVGSFDNEQDYINEKFEKYEEDEEGKGEEWKKKWIGDRKARFQPKFETLLNKYLEDIDMFAGSNENDAKYTLILKTTHTEPGWNIGIMRQPALINSEAIFVETKNHDKILARMIIKDQKGADAWGLDFDTGKRLQEGYAMTGKSLGKFIIKNISE